MQHQGIPFRPPKPQIIANEDWRQTIHRSPDRLDAVVMAVAARWYASFGGAGEQEDPVAFQLSLEPTVLEAMHQRHK